MIDRPHVNDQSSLVLTDIVNKLSMTTTLEMITHIVAQAARKLSGADGATFVLRDGDLCHYADENAIAPLWKGKRFPLQACISGWSMLHREVVVIEDIYKDERIPHDAYKPTFVKSLCMVPIRVEDPIGAIGNYWSNGYCPSETEIKHLQILANSSAIALENLKLKTEIANQSLTHQHFLDCQQEFEIAIQAMAHDLRNPLSTVRLFTELLRDKLTGSVDAQSMGYLDSILTTINRSSEQIGRMLTLYRLSNASIKVEPIDLSPMVSEIGEQLIPRADRHRIEFHVEPNLYAYVDPYLVRLALENLISNALKYSVKQSRPVVHFGASESSHSFQTFFIRDNGVGFDPSDSHKLFRPLVRLHADEDFPGTGLGLASVARIIELHGGHIRAEGQKSLGATFFFSLPVEQAN